MVEAETGDEVAVDQGEQNSGNLGCREEDVTHLQKNPSRGTDRRISCKTDLFEEEPEKKKDDVDSGPEEEEVRHCYAHTFQNHKFLKFKLPQFFGFSTKF